MIISSASSRGEGLVNIPTRPSEMRIVTDDMIGSLVNSPFGTRELPGPIRGLDRRSWTTTQRNDRVTGTSKEMQFAGVQVWNTEKDTNDRKYRGEVVGKLHVIGTLEALAGRRLVRCSSKVWGCRGNTGCTFLNLNRRPKAKEERTGQGMHPPRNLPAFLAGC